MSVRVNSMAFLAAIAAISAFGADTGSIKGAVKYDGTPPAPVVQKLTPNHEKDCKAHGEIVSEALVVDKATNGIQWTIIRVLGVKAPEPKEPFKPVEIDQKGCRFIPHVAIVPVGTSLTVLNTDKIGHNFHTIPLDAANQPLNRMMTGNEEKMIVKDKYFTEPELIQMSCDIHPWMKGFLVVADPRFAAVTGPDGAFEIKDVPPGKYKLSVFQESLGEKTLDVEIKAGVATDLSEIKFKGK